MKNEVTSPEMRDVIRTYYVFRKRRGTTFQILHPLSGTLYCCSFHRVDMDLIDRGNHFVPMIPRPRVRVVTCKL